jgi:predicted flavoprotein YhiN
LDHHEAHPPQPEDLDLAVVGAGAAGLWGGLHAAWRARGAGGADVRIAILDSRSQVGAKILMSGGTRCNLTHAEVTPQDYRGASPRRIARFLRGHPPAESIRVFQEELGLPLKMEGENVYPADDRARSVLEAVTSGLHRAGVPLRTGCRVVGLERIQKGLDRIQEGPDRIPANPAGSKPNPMEGVAPEPTARWRLLLRGLDGDSLPPVHAHRVLVATGGCSYPRTGSDGAALSLLRRLGHTVVPPVPALTPFVMDRHAKRNLSGITTPVRLTLERDGKVIAESYGPLLWTHFGVSGPAVLDLSGHWARSKHDHPEAALRVLASFLPEARPEQTEAGWIETGRLHPQRTIRSHFHGLPQRLLQKLVEEAGVDPSVPLAQTQRDQRKSVLLTLHAYPLPVTDVFGFGKAEVTSGGIPLDEVDDGLESRLLPGIHLAGEVLDVDGRLGGFNFQWAWSSGAVAGRSAVDRLWKRPGPDSYRRLPGDGSENRK